MPLLLRFVILAELICLFACCPIVRASKAEDCAHMIKLSGPRFSLRALLTLPVIAGLAVTGGIRAVRDGYVPYRQAQIREELSLSNQNDLVQTLLVLSPEARDEQIAYLLRMNHSDPEVRKNPPHGGAISLILPLASKELQKEILSDSLDVPERIKTMYWDNMVVAAEQLGVGAASKLNRTADWLTTELARRGEKAFQNKEHLRFLIYMEALLAIPTDKWSKEAFEGLQRRRLEILENAKTKDWKALSADTYFRVSALSDHPEKDLARTYLTWDNPFRDSYYSARGTGGEFYLLAQEARKGAGLSPLDPKKVQLELLAVPISTDEQIRAYRQLEAYSTLDHLIYGYFSQESFRLLAALPPGEESSEKFTLFARATNLQGPDAVDLWFRMAHQSTAFFMENALERIADNPAVAATDLSTVCFILEANYVDWRSAHGQKLLRFIPPYLNRLKDQIRVLISEVPHNANLPYASAELDRLSAKLDSMLSGSP